MHGMPRESRKVVFSDEEVLQAVQSYARMTPNLLPQGSVISAEVLASPDLRLSASVKMNYGNAMRQASFDLTTRDTVELLIRACLENNIPIPRRAEKHLGLVEGELALVIHISTEFAEEPNVSRSKPRLVS